MDTSWGLRFSCAWKQNFVEKNIIFLKKKFDLAEKKILYFNQDFINIVFLMRLSFLSFLRPVQVKKDKKKVRLGFY